MNNSVPTRELTMLFECKNNVPLLVKHGEITLLDWRPV